MAEHSKLLSPSASGLWLNCTAMPQAVIDANLGDQSSEQSSMGTIQHSFAERLWKGEIDPRGPTPDGIPEQEWNEVIIAVSAAKDILKGCSKIAVVYLEKRVDMKGWREDCFGTADIIIWDSESKKLYIIDYKFGRVRVNCINNSQLKVYGIAFLEEHPEIDAVVERVAMSIIQPKIGHGAATFEDNVESLRKWDREVLSKVQKTILDGKGTFNPGPWCGEKYCKLYKAGKCQKSNDNIDGIIDEYFFEDMTPKEIPRRDNRSFFLKLMRYETAIKNLTATAFSIATEIALNGENVPGFKIVNGKGKRSWINEAEADAFLKKKGVSIAARYKSTLITAPQAETVLKKEGKLDSEKAKEQFSAQVQWVEGQKILVHEDDPREAVSFASVDDVIDGLFEGLTDHVTVEGSDFLDDLLNEPAEEKGDDDLLSSLLE